MKALLVRNGFRESIEIVDVKETEKSYMLNGDRFTKRNDSDGCIGLRRSKSSWSSDYYLYSIDSDYAKNKINLAKERNYILKVKRELESRAKQLEDFEEALSLNDLLGLGIKHPHQD